MSTHAPEASATFTILHGTYTSMVLEVRPGEAPLWRYWGPRLPDNCVPLAPLRDGRAIPPSSMEFDQPLTVAPTFGVGWYMQSALLAHRSGQQFAQHGQNPLLLPLLRRHALLPLCRAHCAQRIGPEAVGPHRPAQETEFHNLVRLKTAAGEDIQMRSDSPSHCRVMALADNANYTYMSADLTPSYSNRNANHNNFNKHNKYHINFK